MIDSKILLVLLLWLTVFSVCLIISLHLIPYVFRW